MPPTIPTWNGLKLSMTQVIYSVHTPYFATGFTFISDRIMMDVMANMWLRLSETSSPRTEAGKLVSVANLTFCPVRSVLRIPNIPAPYPEALFLKYLGIILGTVLL